MGLIPLSVFSNGVMTNETSRNVIAHDVWQSIGEEKIDDARNGSCNTEGDERLQVRES